MIMTNSNKFGLLLSSSSCLFLSLAMPFGHVAQSLPVNSDRLIAAEICIGPLCVKEKDLPLNKKTPDLLDDRNNRDNQDEKANQFRTCVKEYLEDRKKDVSTAMDKCGKYSELNENDLQFCAKMYIKEEEYSVPKAMRACEDFQGRETNLYRTCVNLYEYDGRTTSFAKDKCEDLKASDTDQKKKKKKD